VKRRLMRPCLAAAIIVLSTLAMHSCGGKAPEVAAVEWRIEARPLDKGASFESLSVFASIKDEDGLDNIDELWIVNDDAALAWKLTNADWIRTSEGDDNWMGGSALASPEFGPLPRGDYRLISVDAAGQRAEMAFRVSGSFPSRDAPSVSFSGDTLSIRSDWPETLALAFDATGTLLASPAAPKGRVSLVMALGQDIASRAAAVGAYGYDPSIKMGAFSPRVKTR
jgi:hypothetical protein